MTNTQQIQLYFDYQSFFKVPSPILAGSIKRTAAQSPRLSMAETQSSSIQQLLSKLLTFKKFTEQSFSTLTDFDEGKSFESAKLLSDSFKGLMALGTVIFLHETYKTWEKVHQQYQTLIQQGILTQEEATPSAIAQATFREVRVSLLMSSLSTIGSGLFLTPDPTFATKMAAAVLFGAKGVIQAAIDLRNLYGIQRLYRAVPKIPEKENDLRAYTFKERMDQLIEHSKDNSAQIKTIKAYFAAAKDFNAAEMDLTQTKLTAREWNQLVRRTLLLQAMGQVASFFKNILLTVFSSLILFADAVSTFHRATKAVKTAGNVLDKNEKWTALTEASFGGIGLMSFFNFGIFKNLFRSLVVNRSLKEKIKYTHSPKKAIADSHEPIETLKERARASSNLGIQTETQENALLSMRHESSSHLAHEYLQNRFHPLSPEPSIQSQYLENPLRKNDKKPESPRKTQTKSPDFKNLARYKSKQVTLAKSSKTQSAPASKAKSPEFFESSPPLSKEKIRYIENPLRNPRRKKIKENENLYSDDLLFAENKIHPKLSSAAAKVPKKRKEEEEGESEGL